MRANRPAHRRPLEGGLHALPVGLPSLRRVTTKTPTSKTTDENDDDDDDDEDDDDDDDDRNGPARSDGVDRKFMVTVGS